VNSARSDPNRDGFTLSVRGGNGSASTSATEWIGASHVIRLRYGSSAAAASGSSSRFGSSIHASGNASAASR
jgi:hypothetical protein